MTKKMVLFNQFIFCCSLYQNWKQMIVTLYVYVSVQPVSLPTFPFASVQEAWHIQKLPLCVSNNVSSSMLNYDVYATKKKNNKNNISHTHIKKRKKYKFQLYYLKADWSNQTLNFWGLEMLFGFSLFDWQRSFNHVLTYVIFFL